jgi:hypothetical protein
VKAKILNHIELRNSLGVSCHKDIEQCNVAVGTISEYTGCEGMVALDYG